MLNQYNLELALWNYHQFLQSELILQTHPQAQTWRGAFTNLNRLEARVVGGCIHCGSAIVSKKKQKNIGHFDPVNLI